MAEFQELIKNFERIRSYMRQFYVYGFKVRSDYDAKSARTYDNEKRRIEGWLRDYINTDYGAKGKQVSISVDSQQIFQNPLYAAWKSKSFTDNDIMLHFFLLDLLWDGACLTAVDACDLILDQYGVVFDSQTVRLKLKEYEENGILRSQKQGRKLVYTLVDDDVTKDGPLYEALLSAVKFFQETAGFGFIGSTLLDREFDVNRWFSFKHHFIVHTLEDQVLLDVLDAIKEQREISFTNTSTRTQNTSILRGIPLKIFVSTRTGRRFVCIYKSKSKRFINIRLDSMSQVEKLAIFPAYEQLKFDLDKNLPFCWGVSFGGSARLETISMKLRIDEKKEHYVLERLIREGHGGEVQKISDDVFLYTGTYFDTNEMLGWIRTFTGRILDIQGSNQHVVNKLKHDFLEMYRMYHIAD